MRDKRRLTVGFCVLLAGLAHAEPCFTHFASTDRRMAWTHDVDAPHYVTIEQGGGTLSNKTWVSFRYHAYSGTAFSMEPFPFDDATGVYRLVETLITNVPDEMCLVPAGYFDMGEFYEAGDGDEWPVHRTFISAFFMDTFEVSNEKMAEVMQWAYTNALLFADTGTVQNAEGTGKELLDLDDRHCNIVFSGGVFSVKSGMERFPCVEVTWYGAQAYCNYKSDWEGLPRCIDFYASPQWTCDFTRVGYRLPTEAEWEKAARGGMRGMHFPWESYGGVYSQHVDNTCANFRDSGDTYANTTPVGYYDGSQVITNGPGSVTNDMANGYGLYDMAGNVAEWCWDWYFDAFYGWFQASQPNPVGPGLYWPYARVVRGGDYGSTRFYLRVATRAYMDPETLSQGNVGFRAVRRLE